MANLRQQAKSRRGLRTTCCNSLACFWRSAFSFSSRLIRLSWLTNSELCKGDSPSQMQTGIPMRKLLPSESIMVYAQEYVILLYLVSSLFYKIKSETVCKRCKLLLSKGNDTVLRNIQIRCCVHRAKACVQEWPLQCRFESHLLLSVRILYGNRRWGRGTRPRLS